MPSNQIEFALSSMRYIYMKNIERHVDDNNIGNSDAIFQEYIIDNKDPEELDYEWMYLPDLNDQQEDISHILWR